MNSALSDFELLATERQIASNRAIFSNPGRPLQRYCRALSSPHHRQEKSVFSRRTQFSIGRIRSKSRKKQRNLLCEAAHLSLLKEANLSQLKPFLGHKKPISSFKNEARMGSGLAITQVTLNYMLEQLRQDIRYSLRGLLKSAGFSVAAITTLALGIGATTAIFSVADIVLLRSLPYPEPSRLVLVRDELSKMGVHFSGVSYDTYEAYRQAVCFDSAAAFIEEDRNLVGPAYAERISVLSSTSRLPAMLGTHSVLGRGLEAMDWNPGNSNVAVLSYALFARQFAARSGVVGSDIRLDDRLYQVIGIAAPETKLGFRGKGADVWIPLPTLRDPAVWQFQMLARMRPGIDISQAQAAITSTAKHVEAAVRPYRGPNGEDGGYTARVLPLREQMFGDLRAGSVLLTAASFFLLLIAFVNVANLLVARAASREKETVLRRALGASLARLVRQWMTEAAVLAILGGCVGLALAYWGVLLLRNFSPAGLPVASAIAMNGRVLFFTLVTSVFACLFVSLAPAIAMPRHHQNLRGPRRRNGLSNGFITVEVASAIVLLIGCGLLGKTLAKLYDLDTGIQVDNLLTMQVQLSGTRYKQPRQRVAFFSELQDRLSRLPGVLSASAVDRLPIFTVGVDTREGNPFSLEGRPWNPAAQTKQMAHTISVGPDYFRTMAIGLLKGRSLSKADSASAPRVAVINHTLERLFFPNGDAIGKHILFGAPAPGNPWMTIVGVVSDVRNGALDLPAAPQFFMPQLQNANGRMVMVIRTAVDPGAIAREALSAVRILDPEQPVSDVLTMQEHVDEVLAQPRFRAVVASLFGVMALILAAVGIYSVVSNSVTQRTKEIGIRSALGANTTRIVKTIVTDGMRPVAVGVAIGLVGGAFLTRLLATILYQVPPDDPTTLFFAVVLILFISAVACLLPATAAARIDPLIALRED